MFKRKTILFILLVLAFTLTGCAKCGDDICQRWEERRGSCSADCPAANVETPPSPVTPTPDIEPATPPVSEPTTIKGETISVKSFTTIKRNLKTIDWSHTNDLITFGKVGTDGYYDVHVMESDGSRTKCLTCSEPRVPKHNGNPAWHPSGDYIVFTGENKDNTKENKEWALPGTGFNCNLWVMTSDGEKFYQLTDFPLVTPYQAVIHPHFSHDGKKLFWAQKQDPNQGRLGGWGGWALKVADFVVDSQGASLENITTYKPGEESCFYESHAFSSDDQKILFTGNLQSGHPETGIDVYELHLETEKLTRLTSTLNDWDEHANYSPDNKKIAWMSSTDLTIDWQDISGHEWHKDLKSELWIMNVDGSNKQRLTYFNEPEHEHYKGKRTVVSDISWGPSGNEILALVAYGDETGITGSDIILMELE